MHILESGAWHGNDIKYNFDQSLCLAITSLFVKNNIEKVIDIGCGGGHYTNLISQTIWNTIGYDGNYYVNKYNKNCKHTNFAYEVNLGQFDGVLCLEVGEHIPKKYEQIFIDNIKRCEPKLIVLSWAIPGQGGNGHVNEQTNDYIKKQFSEYFFSFEDSHFLRHTVSNCQWFKQTLMVFHKWQQ